MRIVFWSFLAAGLLAGLLLLGNPAAHDGLPIPPPGPVSETTTETDEDPDASRSLAPFAIRTDAWSARPRPDAWFSLTSSIDGRVVDPRSFPIVGARVRVVGAAGLERAVLTDAEGRFSLPRPRWRPLEWTRIGIHAEDDTGRAAFVPALASPGDPLEDIVLRYPGRTLKVRLLRDGRPLKGHQVSLAFLDDDAYPFARRKTGPDGVASFPRLHRGRYLATAVAGARFGSRSKFVSAASQETTIELGPPHEIAVRVTEEGTGTPIAGATVAVSSVTFRVRDDDAILHGDFVPPAPPTDAKGRTTLRGVAPDHAFDVVFEAPQYGRDEESFIAGAKKIELTMIRPVTHRYRVVDGDGPRPPDGTPITVVEYPHLRAVITRGELVVRDVAHHEQGLSLLTPDGRFAEVHALDPPDPGDPLDEVAFRRLRTLEVTVSEPKGAPVVGITVGASPGRPYLEDVTAKTDARGQARLTGLSATEHRIWLRPGAVPEAAAVVDLTSQDGLARIEVEPARDVTVAVTLEGSPGLPAGARVSVAAGLQGPVLEDPIAGTYRFRHRAEAQGEPIEVSVDAPNWVTGTALAPLGPPDEPVRLRVDLRRTVGVVARFVPPLDGKYEPDLVRLDDGEWGRTWFHQEPRDDPHVHHFSALVPGTYRLRDRHSGVYGQSFELSAKRPPPTPTLDLSSIRVVRGRVSLERPGDILETTVEVSADGLESPPVRFTRARSWDPPPPPTFALRLPTDRPLTFRARHPVLRPPVDTPQVTVEAPRGEVEVRLVAGDEARFELSPWTGAVHGRVLLFANEPAGDPVSQHPFLRKLGWYRFANFPHGTWTLWIDAPDRAPLVKRHVNLGPGVNELGTLRLRPGLSLRIEPRANRLGETVLASARPLSGPPFRRWNQGKEPFLITGLAPGRYRLTLRIHRPAGSPRGEVRSVDVREGPVQTVVWELR